MTNLNCKHSPHLIIIRGNSGSGKSTLAKALRKKMKEQYGKGSTMLVSQDTIRIDMLDVSDTAGNDSIELIYDICKYGMEKNECHSGRYS